MVFLVVSQTTWQLWHQVRCSLSSDRSFASIEPSRKSFSSCKNSLQFTVVYVPTSCEFSNDAGESKLPCAVIPLFGLKVPAETFAQLQASAQQSRFHCGNAQSEHFRGLFRAQPFNIAQDEHRPEACR